MAMTYEEGYQRVQNARCNVIGAARAVAGYVQDDRPAMKMLRMYLKELDDARRELDKTDADEFAQEIAEIAVEREGTTGTTRTDS